MNLKDIAEIARSQEKEGDILDGATPSEAHYLQGLTYLEQAYDGYKLDKSLLEKAFECFLQAKNEDAQNPEPYVSLAYIYALLDNKPQVKAHLDMALRIKPDHEEALNLKNALENPYADQDAAVSEPEPIPTDSIGQLDYEIEQELLDLDEREYLEDMLAAPLKLHPRDPEEAKLLAQTDFDELYDDLESLILAQMKDMMQTIQQVKATSDPVQAQEIYYHRFNLLLKQKLLQFHIDIVDQEIDVSELKQKLMPLQIMIRRVDNASRTSEEMLLQARRIQWASASVLLISRLLKDIGTLAEQQLLEQGLEQLMNEVDRMADSLDELDSKGHDIKELLRNYEIVVASVESLQDALDEKHETLAGRPGV